MLRKPKKVKTKLNSQTNPERFYEEETLNREISWEDLDEPTLEELNQLNAEELEIWDETNDYDEYLIYDNLENEED